jgi:hypothetical protein
MSIPGTSLRMPLAPEAGTPISTILAQPTWQAKLWVLKQRLLKPPMPLVLGASGASILLIAILFLIMAPSDGSESAAETGATADSSGSTLGRWPILSDDPSSPDAPQVEEQAGVEVEGIPDAGALEPADEPGGQEPSEPPTVSPQPIKRGTTPTSPGKPKDQRPKWF